MFVHIKTTIENVNNEKDRWSVSFYICNLKFTQDRVNQGGLIDVSEKCLIYNYIRFLVQVNRIRRLCFSFTGALMINKLRKLNFTCISPCFESNKDSDRQAVCGDVRTYHENCPFVRLIQNPQATGPLYTMQMNRALQIKVIAFRFQMFFVLSSILFFTIRQKVKKKENSIKKKLKYKIYT